MLFVLDDSSSVDVNTHIGDVDLLFSDGADNVRDLQFLMHPESEHILDWFHATMRLTFAMINAENCGST